MDQKTVAAYNQFANNYDLETVDFWKRFPRTFIDKFISLVSGKVLDVGSGPGRDAIILRDKGLAVTCFDASDVMVNITTAKGFDSLVGDFSSLPFADDSFDGVWSYTALLHVKKSEVDKPLHEIFRVLKNHGILGLGLIEGETEEYRENPKVPAPRWFSYYNKAEVEDLLDRNNFEIVYFEAFKPGNRSYLNFIARKK